MTTTTQLDRLGILAEELRKLQKTTEGEICFDMGLWCELSNSEYRLTRSRLLEKIEEATRNPCNTYACLAGKAGLIPRIRELGFRWTAQPVTEISGPDSRSYLGEFQFEENHGHDAILAFFGEGAMSQVFLHHSSLEELEDGIKLLEDFIITEGAWIERDKAENGAKAVMVADTDD